MDTNQLLASGVIAAVVSSLFGFISTMLTLRAQRRAEERKRTLDRYDRLYSRIKQAQEKIAQNPPPAAKSTDIDAITEAWVSTTQTLKIWYDAYESCSELFDQDIRKRVDDSVAEYDGAYGAFRQQPTLEGTTTRVLNAAAEVLRAIPEAANEQLERLVKI